MNRRKSIFVVLVLIAGVVMTSCYVRDNSGRSKEVIAIPGGTVSPVLGVGFDVNYDPQLDNVVPGYKILTVAYTNNSMKLIQMDPFIDKWYVIDRRGSKKRAIVNLRNEDPDTWGGLPKRLKVLIEYPLLIPVGETITIDLLFRDKLNLEAFKSVIYQKKDAGQEFRIIPREN